MYGKCYEMICIFRFRFTGCSSHIPLFLIKNNNIWKYNLTHEYWPCVCKIEGLFCTAEASLETEKKLLYFIDIQGKYRYKVFVFLDILHVISYRFKVYKYGNFLMYITYKTKSKT